MGESNKEEAQDDFKTSFRFGYLVAVKANHMSGHENQNWSNWSKGSHLQNQLNNYHMRANNFATMYRDANRENMPREVLQEMESTSRRAGCSKECLMCLSHIKCTDKMMEFYPERCRNFESYGSAGQGSMPSNPGFSKMEPMQQFMAQIDQCEDCTSQCLKGLANNHCSNLMRKWFPQMCSQFADKFNVKWIQW